MLPCVLSAAGLLSRPRIHLDGAQGLELHKAPAALPGVVLTPADPNNLEPEAGGSYVISTCQISDLDFQIKQAVTHCPGCADTSIKGYSPVTHQKHKTLDRLYGSSPRHALWCCAVPAGKAYQGDPPRHPFYLVHCFKPFNGETPHVLLADAFLTPPELFYVSNSIPQNLTVACAPGQSSHQTLALTLTAACIASEPRWMFVLRDLD